MKKILLLFLSFIFIFSISGCTESVDNKNNNEVSYMLNDRQITILESQGMPTEYNQLDDSQKASIEAIEKMLVYLEEKYTGEKFEYSGYIRGSSLEKEQLYATCSYGKVVVEKLSSGAYSDDYQELKSSSIVSKTINDYIKEYTDDNNFLVSVRVHSIDEKFSKKESVVEHSNVNCKLFVNELVGESIFDDITERVSSFLGKQISKGHMCSISFFLVKDEDFSTEIIEEYETVEYSDSYIKSVTYSKKANGEENFY